MKNLTIFLLVIGLLMIGVQPTWAAPYKAADKNPQVVAFYPIGTHGIPSETLGNHEGINLVKANGNSDNFQAWFCGTYPAGNVGFHCHHTVWKISKDGTCPDKATLVPDANPGWGDYLAAGADYCVFDNTFHEEK